MRPNRPHPRVSPSTAQVYDIPEGYEPVAGLFFRDGSFYSFDSGDLTPVETAAFTGTIPELEWPLGFSWCTYDGEIILTDVQTDDRCAVEAIPGCSVSTRHSTAWVQPGMASTAQRSSV